MVKWKEGLVMLNEKDVFLNGEADAYFTRNKNTMVAKGEVSYSTKLLVEFLKNQNKCLDFWKDKEILEVGVCYGYNLKYLQDNLGTICYGIEPSALAVEFGKEKYNKEMAEKNIQLQLICGTSDELPYKDLKFDVVILGFCMFWVDRKYLMKTVSEADRVLKEGGYLVIVDFDTFIPYKKDNVHNPDAWTYKMQYINLFLSNPQYCLVDKKSFSDDGEKFCKEIQERISFNVLYKDNVDNSYIQD